jgi:hypothetical protein
LKDIDTLILKNSRLTGSNNFEFEAVRLIAKSDQPKGGNVENALYGTLEHEDSNSEARIVPFLTKNTKTSFMSAPHQGSECIAKFDFEWADRDPNVVVSPPEPFVTIFPHPCAFLTAHDHYSIRVSVEYPESYPTTTHHKLSVVFMGSLHSDAFEFDWFYRQTSVSAWQLFDHNLDIQNDIEIRLPSVRISSKRFLGDPLEYVRIVIRDGRASLQAPPLAEIQQLIFRDEIDRPMPSQGCFIEKRPIGIRVPSLSK